MRLIYRTALATAVIAVGVIVVNWCLRGESDFPDNLYNLGVIRHSAGPTAHHFIETSCVHMFFEAYPIPRPEDWHRGLYMIVCVLWAKVVGPDHLTAMRVPHLLGVVSWLVLTAAMVRTISKAWLRPGDKVPGLDTNWACLAAVALVGLDKWSCLACIRAWHDACARRCVHSGALVLLLSEKTPSWRTASMVALLCGLAFWIKDFYLLWGPMGAVCLGTAMCLRPRAELTSGSPRAGSADWPMSLLTQGSQLHEWHGIAWGWERSSKSQSSGG